MLTKRQASIFFELTNKVGSWFKANYFSSKYNVSLRTIQNDSKAIKDFSSVNKNAFIIESKVPFGTRIKIVDNEQFTKKLNEIRMQSDELSLNYKDDRVFKLLHFLLNQRQSISLTKCADYIYVSKSTLTTDLKELEKLLNKFSLRLIQTKGLVYIDGLERDKRICLMENDYSYFQMNQPSLNLYDKF